MQIKGIYNRTIFETAKDGVLVGLYSVDDRYVTIKGEMLPTDRGVVYDFEGDWINHPKYGKQFLCATFSEDVSSVDSIVRFLSSPLIKGIGPTLAKRIVETFGEKTIEIMDTNIYAIKEANIKGLSAKAFEDMRASYQKQGEARRVILELGKHNISAKLAMKCYNEFKENTMKIIERAPYKLSKIEGIAFPTADKLGWKIPDYEKSDGRFLYCANYVMYGYESGMFTDILGEYPSGSNCMEINDFGNVMLRLLRINSITPEYIRDKTIEFIKNESIKYVRMNGKKYVMPAGLYEIEKRTAECVANIARYKLDFNRSVVDRVIDNAPHKLSDEQINAIRTAYEHSLSMIIGIPGSGKTTTINTIARSYAEQFPNNGMYFLSLAGRAAAHIKETLDKDLAEKAMISTIHSALSITTDTINHLTEEEVLIENALVIVDEFSMTDSRIAYLLFSSLKNCMVVLCGDDEQLPSVGSGAVLRDLVESKTIPVTVLTHVYRQEAESDIYKNLYKIREGNTELSKGNDFHFIEESEPEKVEDMMLDLYLRKVKEYGIENVMMLAPMKKQFMGIENLNIRAQDKLRPANNDITMSCAYEFRKGDIVMQTKNDYDTMTMNGDLGVITNIEFRDNDKVMTVKYPQGLKEYTKDNIDELSLGYAYTVHKAQGSEAKCVILCAHRNHGRMLKRNLFYTGITRAKKEIYVIGEEAALKYAISKKDTNARVTTLLNELNVVYGNFVDM